MLMDGERDVTLFPLGGSVLLTRMAILSAVVVILGCIRAAKSHLS